MRHHDAEATVGGGEAGDALRRTVGVERISRGRLAVVVDVTQGDHFLCGMQALGVAKVGKAFAVCDDDGHAAAGHTVEQDGGRLLHFYHHEARFKLLGLVA